MKAYLVTCEEVAQKYVVLSSEGERYVVLEKFLCQTFEKSGDEVAMTLTMTFHQGVWNWECSDHKGTMTEVSLIA